MCKTEIIYGVECEISREKCLDGKYHTAYTFTVDGWENALSSANRQQKTVSMHGSCLLFAKCTALTHNIKAVLTAMRGFSMMNQYDRKVMLMNTLEELARSYENACLDFYSAEQRRQLHKTMLLNAILNELKETPNGIISVKDRKDDKSGILKIGYPYSGNEPYIAFYGTSEDGDGEISTKLVCSFFLNVPIEGKPYIPKFKVIYPERSRKEDKEIPLTEIVAYIRREFEILE